MMVVELLPFFNETDILQARIRLMALTVDRQIVAEGDLTHQGEPKPLYLDDVELPATVERIKATMPTGTGEASNWQRERFQRDILTESLNGLDPNALVLSCDLDELVMPYALGRIAEATLHGPVSLGMRMIYYGNRENPLAWIAAKAFRAKDMPKSLSELRLSACPLVPNVGWHLSYLGDTARRRRKVEAFLHPENRPGGEAWERIAEGRDGPNGELLVDFDPAELPATLRELVGAAS